MGITSDCGRIIGIPSMHENQGIEYWGEFKPRRATVCSDVHDSSDVRDSSDVHYSSDM